jgi:hypothetical protein
MGHGNLALGMRYPEVIVVEYQLITCLGMSSGCQWFRPPAASIRPRSGDDASRLASRSEHHLRTVLCIVASLSGFWRWAIEAKQNNQQMKCDWGYAGYHAAKAES